MDIVLFNRVFFVLFLGGSTPVTPIGTKHLKTESGSPAAFSITTEGGMLQTLLHAIELKNQEAASDKDEDKKTKVGQRSEIHTIKSGGSFLQVRSERRGQGWVLWGLWR